MQAPFDIAADLDTPVSAFLKLAPLQPRFLLESVEGGERLARYSFLGFGEVSQVRLDERALVVDGQERPLPGSTAELLGTLREVLAATPELAPVVPDLPFRGGLVGIAGYDLVRYFERLEGAPDGEAIPGVTQYSLMRAADGRSADACRQHWREVHRPLALRIHVGLWSYVQDHVQETLTSTGGDVIGHAQLHFRSHADMREKLFDSEAGKREIFADIGNFMSLERTRVALMTERWLRTPESLRD